MVSVISPNAWRIAISFLVALRCLWVLELTKRTISSSRSLMAIELSVFGEEKLKGTILNYLDL